MKVIHVSFCLIERSGTEYRSPYRHYATG